MSALPEQFASLSTLKAFVATGNEFEELDAGIVGKWTELNSLSTSPTFCDSGRPCLMLMALSVISCHQSCPTTLFASSPRPFLPSPTSPSCPHRARGSRPPRQACPTSPPCLIFVCSPSLTTPTSPLSRNTSHRGAPASCLRPTRPTRGRTTLLPVRGEETVWRLSSSVGVGWTSGRR